MGFSAVTRPVERLLATAQNGLEVLRYGGLETGAVPSPFQIIESVPMYRLRRYFPPDARPGARTAGPPVLMVHPMMMSADMWDVTRDDGAVGILHARGHRPVGHRLRLARQGRGRHAAQPGRPRRGAERGDRHGQGGHRQRRAPGRLLPGRHVRATRPRRTGGPRTSPASSRSVHRWTPWPRCRWACPPSLAAGAADFMADHVFSRHRHPGLAGAHRFPDARPDQDRAVPARLPASAARPRGPAAARTAAPVPGSEGWIAWSGPAIAELLKQFIAHNRMMTGGFAIRGELVTLADIDCPVLAFVGEVDDIGQPASVRGIKRAAPQGRRLRIPDPGRPFRPGGRIEGGDADLADGGGLGEVARRRRRHARRRRPDGAAARRAHRERCLRSAPGSRTAPRAASEMAFGAGPVGGRRGGRRQQVGAHAGRRDRPHAAPAGPARPDQRPHPDLARPHHDRAGARRARRRIPAVRRPRAHLRGGGPPHQQRRPRPHRGRGAAGRPRRRADGDPAQRAGRDRRAVPAGCGGGADAARRRPGRGGPARRGVRDHRRPEPTWRRRASSHLRVLVLGGGEIARPAPGRRRRRDVVDMEQIDPDVVELPGWYRPNPGLARDLAFVAFSVDRRRAGRPADHQLPLGAVGVRHRVGGQPRPRRHRVLPDAAAPPVRAAGQPGRRRRRRHPHRAVARAAAGPVRPGDPAVRRHRGLLHLGDAARRHRRPVVLADTATTRCGCSSARACRPGCGNASWRCSRRPTSSSSSRPPTGRRCWPTCPAPRSAARAGRCPAAGRSSWPPTTPTTT